MKYMTCVEVFSPHSGMFVLGEQGVTQILEHSAAGDGDKWYYDVLINRISGGEPKVTRIFDVVRSLWE